MTYDSTHHTPISCLCCNSDIAPETQDGACCCINTYTRFMIKFYGIHGPHGFCSNFYCAEITIEKERYLSNEHYYQAMKTLDPDERTAIRNAPTPGKAKRLGSKCTLREDWDSVVGTEALHKIFSDDKGIVVELVKDHLMCAALTCKFTQHPDLRDALLQTGAEELVEDSPTDLYWGIGRDGTGKNKLGRMLVLIRSRLTGIT
jgi:ribA/ribD-fused uncharacterized protein